MGLQNMFEKSCKFDENYLLLIRPFRLNLVIRFSSIHSGFSLIHSDPAKSTAQLSSPDLSQTPKIGATQAYIFPGGAGILCFQIGRHRLYDLYEGKGGGGEDRPPVFPSKSFFQLAPPTSQKIAASDAIFVFVNIDKKFWVKIG